ncbi:DNA-3-methyladenine glycosylase [Candidatus Bathyarchaeota archaeon]|nr:MAG: DNA-3-methyladenine glycosylase [Candidatus Bathyarchaeota archaeon]
MTLKNPEVLPRSFYSRDTLTVAKELLGKYLVRQVGRKMVVGKIVEVEAYGGSDDPASHAYRGITPRNKLMFGEAGHAYIYFTYGNHYCLNVTTEKEGKPGAVLIRAIEPVKGIDLMKKHRKTSLENLTNGPGKLTQALKITKKQNGLDLTKKGELFICFPQNKEKIEIVSSRRIGIKVGTEKLWRFYIKNNPFVSKR